MKKFQLKERTGVIRLLNRRREFSKNWRVIFPIEFISINYLN